MPVESVRETLSDLHHSILSSAAAIHTNCHRHMRPNILGTADVVLPQNDEYQVRGSLEGQLAMEPGECCMLPSGVWGGVPA